MSLDVDTVVRAISAARVNLSIEKTTQAELHGHLAKTCRGYPIEREVRLAEGEVIDLLVDGIGIEVKLRGANKMDVFRQLRRYAKHDRIRALILATNLSMGLPSEIEGKPAYFVSLGRAWL